MAVDETADRLYVSAESENAVRVFSGDLFPTGVISPVIAPRGLHLDTATNKLYVVSALGPNRGVSVYDTTSLALVDSLSLPLWSQPIYVHVDAGTLYVTGLPPTLLIAA